MTAHPAKKVFASAKQEDVQLNGPETSAKDSRVYRFGDGGFN
jgi:hypothetical protein